MNRLILVLLASAAASPSLAQHSDHAAPAPVPSRSAAPAPSTICTPEHAAMGHCTMPAPAPPPAATCTPEHASMGHCTMPAPTPAPPAACTPEHAAMGHCAMPAPVPAPAQTCTSEHAAMGHCTMPAPPAVDCTPEHAAMGHCNMPRPAPAPPQGCTPEHAAMGHCTVGAPTTAPSPSCTPEHAAMGHCTMPTQPGSTTAADPHAGHGTQSGGAPLPLEGPAPPEALTGPTHAADLVFDPSEMAQARSELAQEHGRLKTWKFLLDRLEVSTADGHEGYSWDAQFWYGGDIDKLWLKTEGEGDFGGELEGAQLQALWSRAINPWFDLQAGIRQDIGSGPDRTHLALGVQGLAPYWLEVDGAVFLSTEGEVTASFEAEYDLRLTQRLILQPSFEADFSLQNVPELRTGSGLTGAELGARLRYEFYPASGPAVLAPYVGIQYERAFGRTADFRRADGEGVSDLRLLLGIRTWF